MPIKPRRSPLSVLFGRKLQLRRPALHIEQLESRLVPCVMPNVTPAIYAAMTAEVQHVLNLVPDSAVTDEAIKSGNYSDASIWSAGHAPTALDNVLIDSTVSVTVDTTHALANTMRIDGRLSFSGTVDTLLSVDTLVVNAGGDYEQIVTQARVASGLTFADSGPINRVWDPYGLSRQLIAVGNMLPDGTMVDSATVNIIGAKKDGWESIAGVSKGTQTIQLPNSPTGWAVGDTLLFNSTGNGSQDETVTITGISDKTVTLSVPLVYNHLAPVGQSTTVANLTRNVVIQSAGTLPSELGGTMFMHTGGGTADGAVNQWGTPESVTLEYASFVNLGRTDKSKPINDAVVANGVLQSGTGTNPRARYAVHFHRDYNFDANCTIQVTGNVVEGGPGWGYDNHSSNVDFTDNIDYGTYGAGFVTEAGDEIGSFVHDLSVHNTANRTLGNTYDAFQGGPRLAGQDFAFAGDGFWFQGRYGLKIENNVAAESTEAGFYAYNQGLKQAVFSPTSVGQQFDSINVTDPAILAANPGKTLLNTDNLPLEHFTGNTAIYSNDGLYLGGASQVGLMQQVIDFTSYNTVRNGIELAYASSVNIDSPVLLAIPGTAKTVSHHEGIAATFGYTGTEVVTDADIEGFGHGVEVGGKGVNLVSGGYFDNYINLYFGLRDATGHVDTVSGNVQFGSLSTALNGDNYFLEQEGNSNAGGAPSALAQSHFRPNVVLINTTDHPNSELFYDEQGFFATPFTLGTGDPTGHYVGGNFSADQLAIIPASLKAMTNGQLMAAFGETYFGASAPQDAVILLHSNGLLIGAAQPQAPAWLKGGDWATVTKTLAGFVPKAPDGTTFAPVNLHEGLNFIPEFHNGQLYSEIVYADDVPPTVALAPNQILTASLASPPTAFVVHYTWQDASVGSAPQAKTATVNLAALFVQQVAGVKTVAVTIKTPADASGNFSLLSFDVVLI